jgi:leucyl aminopeptidase (aminopeptidase T)
MRSKHWKFTLWGFRLSNACTEYRIENDTSWDFMIEKSEMAVDGSKVQVSMNSSSSSSC